MRSTVTRYLFALVTLTGVFTNSGTTIWLDEIIFISSFKSVHKIYRKETNRKRKKRSIVSYSFIKIKLKTNY